TIDTAPPVLQLVSPASGAIVPSAQPTITISVSDNLTGVNAQSETLSIDGQTVNPQRTASQIQYAVPSPLAQGPHSISATAADNPGNVGNLSASFTIDSAPPTPAQITSLAPGQVLAGSVQLAATATDAGSGVARIDVLVDGSFLVSLPAPN